MNRPRYTHQQVMDALAKAQGVMGTAAQALGCTRQTVHNYIERWPAIKEVRNEAVQMSIDRAHSKLLELVDRGEWQAIRFLLVTQGRDRGFSDRGEGQVSNAWFEARCKQYEAELERVYGDGK